MFSFTVLKENPKSRARTGRLETPHGSIETPAFVPVATKGALRGVDFDTVGLSGGEIFMVNTYHFFQLEREKTVKKFGGLHKFLGIDYPLMTDSGGFQVFSLGFGREHNIGKVTSFIPRKPLTDQESQPELRPDRNLVKITDDGVEFRSLKDGRRLFMDPKISIQAQKDLGADIIFAFDECTSPLADYHYTKESLERTHRWAKQSLEALGRTRKQALFGIVQGGPFQDLREESAQFITSLPFAGFGIGGAMGDSKASMGRVLDWIYPYLPADKPRHLLGLGEVDDILEGVERGMDTFDCVVPTRWARHGVALTDQGRFSLRSARYLTDKTPIDRRCSCPVCSRYSKGYISHLIREKEIFGIMLLTEHNLAWMQNLMKDIRSAINSGQYRSFKDQTLRRWRG